MQHGFKARCRTTLFRRPRSYRPHLEILEERLPPGDTVLGALLALEGRQSLAQGASHGNSEAAAIQTWKGGSITASAPSLSLFRSSPGRETPDSLGSRPELTTFAPGELNNWLGKGIDSVDFVDWDFAGDRLSGRPPRHLAQGEALPARAVRTEDIGLIGHGALQGFEGRSIAFSAMTVVQNNDAHPLYWLPAFNARPFSVSEQGSVHALFNLDVKAEAPFPTNWFTVPDRSNLTNRRVNLPLPDCKVYISDCEDLNVINELDGFNLQPRLSMPFDGAIDVKSVNSQDVFLINLGDTVDHHEHGDHVVGINQIVWDPPSQTLHVESDQLLDQHTEYALIVTNGIRDAGGHPVEATDAFRRFRQTVRGEYKHELLDAIHAARRIGVRERDIVTASVFTTESATAMLEKIRDQIHAATPEPADFLLGPKGERTVFNFDDVTGIHWEQQTGDDPPTFTPTNLNLAPFRDVYPGAVGELAFGKYLSPDYEVHPGEYIPPVATRTGTPVVQGMNEIYFNLILPSGPRPTNGWPVVIFGHGGGVSKNTAMFNISASLAHHGIATILINVVGHGFGPLSTLTVNQATGGPVTFLEGGRGIDQDGNHIIESSEGFSAATPRTLIAGTDGQRQTVADLMQLVRVIQVGMEVHGDGVRDLDPSRIYYWGGSTGGHYGIPFLAVEPDVRAGTPYIVGSTSVEANRLSPVNRPSLGRYLDARVPSLINPPGLTSIGGVGVDAPYFDENIPLRDRPPVINTVPGAMAIQQVIDNREWVSLSGEPLGYVSHLRKDPLPGVPAKSVLIVFAKGDQTVPNPTTTAMLRAGDLADRATFYRHDLAFAEDPALLRNPHTFVAATTSPDPLARAIALGAQEEFATFFESDGTVIIHPEPARFFETPIHGPLPEELNFIPDP